jgi:hypothetical protein
MQHADALTAILIAVMMGSILLCYELARRGHVPFVRKIAGVSAMEEAVGRATEMGRPIVFAMGYSDIQAIETHASLPVLSHVARLAARMQTPLICFVQLANVYPVVEETIRQAYVVEGVGDQFQPDKQVRFLSEDAVIYATGVARTIEETRAGCAIFFGAFCFTSLLMAEPGARLGVLQIAGDPTLWQMPFFICTCDHTILGEEYYAAGAYVSPDPTLRGTLRSQDIIKLVFAAMIVIGTICSQFGWPRWLVEALTKYK